LAQDDEKTQPRVATLGPLENCENDAKIDLKTMLTLTKFKKSQVATPYPQSD
jgi:hypothetical protein